MLQLNSKWQRQRLIRIVDVARNGDDFVLAKMMLYLPNSLVDDGLFLVVNRVQANENAALAVKVANNVTHVGEFSVRDRERR